MNEQMSWLHAIVLGISQGLTEFLPISSTAHALVISKLLGWPDPGAAFTAVSQIGTEIAVVIYFRHDIARIIKAWLGSIVKTELRSDLDAKMGWYVIFGTLPIGVAGLAFKTSIETTARNLWLVAGALFVMGLLLGVVDRYAKHNRDEAGLNPKTAVLFGFGTFGVLVRRNPLVMFMCIELMLNAVNLSFVTLARQLNDINGQTIVFFVMVVAAAEVVVGLGIIVAIMRNRSSVTADDLAELKG
jgi:undecaprenyl pyrophosphate phosphatase UppP